MTQFNLEFTVENTLEIKKSQFITWLLPVSDKQQAKQHLEKAKQQYPDARHHCWAYKIGDSINDFTAAMSDDGEPSGTAGKPMLNVLQHKPVNNVMVIVIRYFGGIKLGAGGLVRAYSQAVEQAFQLAELTPIIIKSTYVTVVPFKLEQLIRHYLEQYQGDIITTNYHEQVEICFNIPAKEAGNLQRQLRNHNIDICSKM